MTNTPFLIKSICSEIDANVVLIQIFEISNHFSVQAAGMPAQVFDALDQAEIHAQQALRLFYKSPYNHPLEMSVRACHQQQLFQL